MSVIEKTKRANSLPYNLIPLTDVVLGGGKGWNHQKFCVFCGGTIQYPRGSEPSGFCCDASKTVGEMREAMITERKKLFPEIKAFIEANRKFYVVFTGKKNFTVVRTPEEMAAIIADKEALQAERARLDKIEAEKREAERKVWEEEWRLEKIERDRLEKLRLGKVGQLLGNASLKEMVDHLIYLTTYVSSYYDDFPDNTFKEVVTIEELAGYIKGHYNELIDREIRERKYQESLDD